MKILIHGAGGHMGRVLRTLCENGMQGAELAGLVDAFAPGDGVLPSLSDFSGEADCLIDFSNHAATESLLDFALERKMPVIVCTTGQTEQEREMIFRAAKQIPVFFSANMSLGVAVLAQLVKTAVKMFPDADVEIIEQHHNRKLDVPSGTALMLGKAVQQARPEAVLLTGRHEYGKRSREEVGIHSVRMGTTVGIHEVLIHTGTQVLSLKHEAHDRALFAEGAISAAAFLVGRQPGLYDMNDLLRQV